MAEGFRTERDTMGELQVPADRYYRTGAIIVAIFMTKFLKKNSETWKSYSSSSEAYLVVHWPQLFCIFFVILVPVALLHGCQTARSILNFPIGDRKQEQMPIEVVRPKFKNKTRLL